MSSDSSASSTARAIATAPTRAERVSQDGFVSPGVGGSLSHQADKGVNVSPYLSAVGLSRSRTGSRGVGRERRHGAADLRVVAVSFADVAIDDLCKFGVGVQAFASFGLSRSVCE